jgi:3-hydroxy-4-methylanthranilate adenylyltransferase
MRRNVYSPILENGLLNDLRYAQADGAADPDWVDEYLLGGNNDDCIVLGEPFPRGTLRTQVADRAAELRSAGLRPGGAISLRLPPSLAYVVNLLAAWRLGAQVSLLDHRLTPYEVDKVLTRIAPQFVVSAPGISGRLPRTYADVKAATAPYSGHPARTGHALLQLSSGSTGTPKIIGRTAADIAREIERYARIDGTPREGERIILLASMVHVLGLVGGLLYGLHAGAQLVLPRSLTPDAVLDAVTGDDSPATVLGVPFHLRLLLTADAPAGGLPQLKRVTVAGEPTSPQARDAFASRYQVPLGNMYGMTEVGVIATDLSGQHYPALTPAPGMTLREESGQLLLASPASPYLDAAHVDAAHVDAAHLETRRSGGWSDGWLRTGDAGVVDAAIGLVTVLGRGDSQVSVGGLKVDLTEVEQTIAALPGVAEAVVVFDGSIETFVMLAPGAGQDAAAGLRGAMASRLAPYKIPRKVNVVAELPRTSSGKRVRNISSLRAAGSQKPVQPQRSPNTEESVSGVS